MPLVHIDMVEGRAPEKIEKMITAVSEAVSASLEAPIGSVRVIVNEMKPHQYGIGGKAWPQILEDRAQGGGE